MLLDFFFQALKLIGAIQTASGQHSTSNLLVKTGLAESPEAIIEKKYGRFSSLCSQSSITFDF